MKEHTRVARARRGIERRLFLQAVGLGMSAPIAWQLSRSAVAQAQEGPRPKRLMVYFMPHGVPPEHFNPVFNPSTPTQFSLNQSGVSILGSLEPYKQYVSVLQGFSYPGASTHEGILSVLSNFGDGRAVDDTSPRTTFEHVIANALGARPLVLGAVPHRPCGIDKDGKLMWDGQYVVPEKNPLVAFDRTFGSLGGGQQDVNVQLRNALTQLTESQLGSLSTELSGLTGAQSKLSVHLESVQSLRLGAGVGSQSCDAVPALPALDLIRQQSAGQPLEGNPCGGFFLDEANFPAILDAQLQLAAQALICNATPVVAVQPMYTNADINFSFMGSPGSHHAMLSHTSPGSSGSGLSLQTRTPFANAQKWFVDKLVTHVVSALMVPDPADPGRTVLDNTLIYMFAEIGEGAWHTSRTTKINFDNINPPAPFAYMPITLIGGGGGAIKTGQIVRVNNDPNPQQTGATQDRPAGDIYLALCKAMGVEIASFGNATNPLTEILA
jgi:hypothetical protein